MERNKVKQGIVLITYAVILVLFLVYCKDIIRGIGSIIELFQAFFIGIIIAFILSQPYAWLKRIYQDKLKMQEKVAHRLALVSAYLLVFAVIAAVIGVVIPQLASSVRMFAVNIEFYLGNLQLELDTWGQRLHVDVVDLSNVTNLINTVAGQMDDAASQLAGKVVSVTSTMLSTLATFIIAIVFSVYLMAGRKKILSQINRLLRAYLPQDIYDNLKYLLKIIVTSFKNYIIGQSIEAAILGSLCFAGMLILRLDYAGMVSMVVALTALIPILGAYIGGAVAVVLLLMVSPVKAGIFLVFFVILQQVENNVIYPRVVGGRIGLPGIWVLLAITVGGKLGGVVGMLFGVPIMTVLYTLLKNSVRSREKKKEQLSYKK